MHDRVGVIDHPARTAVGVRKGPLRHICNEAVSLH
jgi:hypothetical protein